MSELESLVKNLSDKFDGLQNDLDKLKRRSGKRKKHGKRHSRRHHRRHSDSSSRSRSRSNHREDSLSRRGSSSSRRERSRSRSTSSPRRGSRGRHDRGSGSPAGVDEPSLKNRRWHDIPDTPQYDETLEWEFNSDIEVTEPERRQAPPTNVASVSEEMATLITEACTVRLENPDRLKIRNTYSLPKVTASRTPQLDNYLKTEVQSTTRAVDKELATIQSHILDALAPLSAILESQDVPEETASATVAAIKLLGNTSARISHLRRSKVISQINKALLPLVEEDSNFGEVSPSLFGPEFAQKSKQLVDQVKAMRSTLATPKPFFRPGPPNSRGGVQQPETEPRRRSPERRGKPGEVVPEKHMEKVTHAHTILKSVMMNWKTTLVNQIACLGVVHHYQPDLPQAGRLVHYLTNWSAITQDQWVLNTVRGYQIDFVAKPHQGSLPTPPHHTSEQVTLIQEELAKLLQKQAIQPVECPSETDFYSNIFLVPKKDGGQRPVINLKALNSFVHPEHFKMEGIHTLKELLGQGDWLAKVDLKDAYFAIPIHQTHQKYLHFQFQEKAFRFTCLPFGLSSAPWVFTKTLKPALAILRQRGVRMIAYIDDILLIAGSKDQALDHAQALVHLLESLGFIINTEKSVLTPSQTIEFLGLSVSSIDMELRLPLAKIKQIRAEARKMMRMAEPPSARTLARLLGKMNSTTCVIPPAPLFYRSLQMAFSNTLETHSQNYEGLVMLLPDSLEELQWWDTEMSKWNGKTLLKREVDMVIDSDASLQGWGARCGTQTTRGAWSQRETALHINCLELLAATLAVQSFAKGQSRLNILLRIDNTTAVAYINHLGGTVSRELVNLTKNLWMWCLERNIHITAQHLPGIQNTVADAESRSQTDRTDWKLSPNIFHKIQQTFGPLEVDLFATRLSAQCQRYFSWRPDPSAEATDAFLQVWTHIKGYANPPWNLVGRTLAQIQTHKANLVLVAPVWRSQPWYPTLLHMLVDYPRLIAAETEIMVNRDSSLMLPQLAVWHISGRDTEINSFRKMLWTSCSAPGGPKQTNPMTHSLLSGIAGVLNGVQIPFLAL